MYYAVRVQSTQEDNMIALINERVNKNIFNEVFTPKRVVGRKVNGEWIDKKVNIFPGYIFVDTDKPKEFSSALYWMPQYGRILGRDQSSGDYVPLTKDEGIMIDSLCGKDVGRILEASKVVVREGKQIDIISGPLIGLQGTVKKIDLHKRIAIVTLNILNCSEVHVPLNILREKV